MKRGVFVTGTDTGVGKTTVSALLLAALKRRGIAAGYFKPAQTGTDEDTPKVRSLARLEEAELAWPVYHYPEPISPSRAAPLHGERIELGRIAAAWQSLPDRSWVVEGAGGLLTPLNERETFRELARCLGLPVLVVSSTRLGTINHTLLTLEALRKAELQLAGVVLVGDRDPGLAEVLEETGGARVLAEIPIIPSLSGKELDDTLAMRYFSGFSW